MFCPKCGAQNVDDAKFCVNCGSQIEKPEGEQAQMEQAPIVQSSATETAPAAPVKTRMSGCAIAGFVLSLVGLFTGSYGALICGILGIVFSAIGMRAASINPQVKGKGLAIAGLVISIVEAGIILVFMLLFVSAFL